MILDAIGNVMAVSLFGLMICIGLIITAVMWVVTRE